MHSGSDTRSLSQEYLASKHGLSCTIKACRGKQQGVITKQQPLCQVLLEESLENVLALRFATVYTTPVNTVLAWPALPSQLLYFSEYPCPLYHQESLENVPATTVSLCYFLRILSPRTPAAIPYTTSRALHYASFDSEPYIQDIVGSRTKTLHVHHDLSGNCCMDPWNAAFTGA
jgi:hypothetical protein